MNFVLFVVEPFTTFAAQRELSREKPGERSLAGQVRSLLLHWRCSLPNFAKGSRLTDNSAPSRKSFPPSRPLADPSRASSNPFVALRRSSKMALRGNLFAFSPFVDIFSGPARPTAQPHRVHVRILRLPWSSRLIDIPRTPRSARSAGSSAERGCRWRRRRSNASRPA